MDSARLNDWLQVVGLFGVIASLIFVGLQMRQDREIALANSYQARTSAVAQAFHSRAANLAALSAGLRTLGINPDDPVRSGLIDVPDSAGTITELEFSAGRFSALATWLQWDNAHFQYEAGFLPESHWLRTRSIIKAQFRVNSLIAMVYRGTNQRPSFQREIDEVIAEVEAESAQ